MSIKIIINRIEKRKRKFQMAEDSSENKYNISCDECGHVISDEFIKENQNKILYCELCGGGSGGADRIPHLAPDRHEDS